MRYCFTFFLIIAISFFSNAQDFTKSFDYEPGIELDYNVPTGYYLNSWPNISFYDDLEANSNPSLSLSMFFSNTLMIKNGIIEGNIGLTYSKMHVAYTRQVDPSGHNLGFDFKVHQFTLHGQLLGGYQFDLRANYAIRLVTGFYIGENFTPKDKSRDYSPPGDSYYEEEYGFSIDFRSLRERLSLMGKLSFLIPTKNLENSFEINIKYHLMEFAGTRFNVEIHEKDNIIYQSNAKLSIKGALTVGASFNF